MPIYKVEIIQVYKRHSERFGTYHMKHMEVLTVLPEIISLLRKNDVQGYNLLNKNMERLNNVIMEFIDRIPEFKKMDIDVPEDVLLNQINNLVEGYENKDNALLADTLEYEITEALLMYQEIAG